MVCGVPPQHRWSAQRWADGISLWPNAVLALNRPLGQYTQCLGYSRILINIVIYIKKCFWKSENSKKNEIITSEIHNFITKLKKKIDVITMSRFKLHF